MAAYTVVERQVILRQALDKFKVEGWTVVRIAKYCEVSQAAVYKWRRADDGSLPHSTTCAKLIAFTVNKTDSRDMQILRLELEAAHLRIKALELRLAA